jgi:hypothetical protein
MFFLDRDRNQNIFDWNPHPKFVSDGTGTKTLNFFSPGPRPGSGPEFFFAGIGTKIFFLTGTKNHWSRSCLVPSLLFVTLIFDSFREIESSSSDEDDDETINDEDIRQALLPTQSTTTPAAPSNIKRRQRQSSTSSTEETKIEIPARPHANVQVERSEEIQTIRSQLPIITEEQVIMEAIHDNLVVLICGETGKKNSFY